MYVHVEKQFSVASFIQIISQTYRGSRHLTSITGEKRDVLYFSFMPVIVVVAGSNHDKMRVVVVKCEVDITEQPTVTL